MSERGEYVRAWGEMQVHRIDFMCSPARSSSLLASALLVTVCLAGLVYELYEHGGACEVRSARRELNPKLPTWSSRDGLEALPRLPDPRHLGIRPQEPLICANAENPRSTGRFFARLTGLRHGRRCSEQLHNPPDEYSCIQLS